jgi:hypothetical protein
MDDDEADGMDETLVPLDFDGNDPRTFLTDDELKSSFFDVIPNGVFVTAIYDCCHSGTMSDLAPGKQQMFLYITRLSSSYENETNKN